MTDVTCARLLAPPITGEASAGPMASLGATHSETTYLRRFCRKRTRGANGGAGRIIQNEGSCIQIECCLVEPI